MMSLTTESSLMLASSRVFCSRWTCRVCSRTSCLRVRISERSSWISSGGTKLALSSPQASRSAIHMASFMSVLRPGLLDVRGVGDNQGEVALAQDLPHRRPIHAGRFHRDMRDPARRQPPQQFQQTLCRGGESSAFARWSATSHDPHAGHDRLLMDIETGHPAVHYL